MAKPKMKVSFTFENPNRDEDFERVYRQILIDKLVAQQRDENMAA